MTRVRPAHRRFGVLAAASEAAANIVVTPASLLIALVAGAATAVVLLFSVQETSTLQRRYDEQVAAGRFVLVAVAGPEGLDASRCEELGAVDGVDAAGSVLASRTVRPAALPFRPYQVTEVTPGAVRAYFPLAPATTTATLGILAGPVAAEELGLVGGGQLTLAARGGTATEILSISAVLPPSDRSSDLDRHLLAVRPAQGPVDACVVSLVPDRADSARPVVESWFPSRAHVVVQRLPDAPDPHPTPEAEMAGRLSRHGWAVAAVAVALVALSTWHGRREEVALYRLLDVSPAAIVTMFATETALLVVLPQAIGASLALAVMHDDLVSTAVVAAAAVDLARVVVALTPLPLVATAWHLRRSPFDTLKGR